jgi:DNA excision repair protein ERCC-3
MYYSTKRQQFLIDQGYSFKVITSLPPADTGADLSYHKLSDQLDLLSKVLSAGDEAAGIEQLDEDMDDITRNRFTRTHANMSTISGSDGRFYMEYRFSFPPV